MKTILIVEDDKKLNDGIKLALRNEFFCLQAFSLQSASDIYQEQSSDLIILDVNLPDGDGMDFLTEIRKTDDVPVILLTANKMEMDIVSGLELGANDYITKPCSLMVLRARVGVQLRDRKTSMSVGKQGKEHESQPVDRLHLAGRYGIRGRTCPHRGGEPPLRQTGQSARIY